MSEQHSNTLYYMVWGGLLILTIVEIILGYLQFSTTVMLLTLIGLSLFKAGLIMAYFMHLKFEKFSLVLTLIPMTLICIGLFAVFFPDSLRVNSIGTHQDSPAAHKAAPEGARE
jgi:cytochrome c oxidase subunit 4